MSVLRTETQEIPAKTIETTIIGIPAVEWKKMEIKRLLAKASSYTLFLGSCLGLVLFIWHHPDFLIRLQQEIESITGAPQYVAVLMGSVLSLVFILPAVWVAWEIQKYALLLDYNLLKKHGWDGQPRYRIELEYQQFLHE